MGPMTVDELFDLYFEELDADRRVRQDEIRLSGLRRVVCAPAARPHEVTFADAGRGVGVTTAVVD